MAKPSTQSLSIDALESDLKHASGELKKATGERLRAHEVENQWLTEVNSLKSLIEVRRKRLQPTMDGRTTHETEISEEPPDPQDLAALQPDEAVSHVDWINNNVAASGNHGVSPPELLKFAEDEGRKMHRNYPYIVLRNLVEQGKVTKKGGRYFKKGN